MTSTVATKTPWVGNHWADQWDRLDGDKTLPTADWFDIGKFAEGRFETTGFMAKAGDRFEDGRRKALLAAGTEGDPGDGIVLRFAGRNGS